MIWIAFLILASAPYSLAADRIVSLWIPDADPQPLAGSIVAENPGTTTYSINCPPGTDSANCGMGPGLFLTTAQHSVEWLISDKANDAYNHVVCTSTDLTGGVRTCIATVTGKAVKTPGSTSTTLSEAQATPLPVMITSNAVGNTAGTTSRAMTDSTATPTAGTNDGVGGRSGSPGLSPLILACVVAQALAASL
ncbi:hypothetical protein N7535_001749 [Penicillium sp. DV-2018c]|nr:hypothetical protein N7535_001749 [Penicillium sp. DV-2018c]